MAWYLIRKMSRIVTVLTVLASLILITAA